jgi:hypothetical protein
VLVLQRIEQRIGKDDALARSPSLPEPQTAGCQGGGMEGKDSGGSGSC